MLLHRPEIDKATQTASRLANRVNGTFTTLLATYKDLMATVHANPDGLTAEEIYTALGAENTAAVKECAVLIKSIINKVKPGAITDDIPEATITLPQ